MVLQIVTHFFSPFAIIYTGTQVQMFFICTKRCNTVYDDQNTSRNVSANMSAKVGLGAIDLKIDFFSPRLYTTYKKNQAKEERRKGTMVRGYLILIKI